MEVSRMSLGRNIASRRKSQNFSQEDIATLVGVSRQAVSKWEKDLSSPSTENIIRLAEILRVSVEELTPGGSRQRQRRQERVPCVRQ
jgi:transcriptional regulator with XRE-family HTH domain